MAFYHIPALPDDDTKRNKIEKLWQSRGSRDGVDQVAYLSDLEMSFSFVSSASSSFMYRTFR